jgi:hypothetical protein
MSFGTEQNPPPDFPAVDAAGRNSSSKRGGIGIMEFLILFAIVLLWFALQAWILPAVGVST